MSGGGGEVAEVWAASALFEQRSGECCLALGGGSTEDEAVGQAMSHAEEGWIFLAKVSLLVAMVPPTADAQNPPVLKD